MPNNNTILLDFNNLTCSLVKKKNTNKSYIDDEEEQFPHLLSNSSQNAVPRSTASESYANWLEMEIPESHPGTKVNQNSRETLTV